IGGAPEGVITAAAMRCVGGDMQGRLRPRNDEEVARAKKMGIADINRIYTAEELAKGEVMFAATGVTSGDFLKGVRFYAKGYETDVHYVAEIVKTIKYTVRLKEEKPSRVSWTFVEGEFMKDNKGSWDLEDLGNGTTKATYSIEVTLGALVPKTIVNALVDT